MLPPFSTIPTPTAYTNHGGPCRFGCDLAERCARHHGAKTRSAAHHTCGRKNREGTDRIVRVWSWILPLTMGKLGGGNFKDFLEFSPRKFGEDDSQFDEHIFQRGWFNHQPGDLLALTHFEHFVNTCTGPQKSTLDICRWGDCFLSHSLGWILGWFYRWFYKSPVSNQRRYDISLAWHVRSWSDLVCMC